MTTAPIESADDESGKLSRLLELELAQKRLKWKRASARYRTIRSLGFLFLFILIIGTLLAFFFVFSRVNEERTNPRGSVPSAASKQ
jgi:hypothetical protein